MKELPSVRSHGVLAKIHGKFLASLAKILPYLSKDTMAMQDCAKANHELSKDDKIKHVLDKGSMVANPFFRNSYFLNFIHFFALVFTAFSNFSNFSRLPQ